VIDAYVWNTPNGHKLGIALEELGLPYTVHHVDLMKNAQQDPAFLAINPNGRIPAIVDREGPGGAPLSVFESGAILIYLAEKAGKLLPADPRGRSEAIQWLMFQMAGVGPMFGQLGFFRRMKEPVPVAIERYTNESKRLLGVLDGRLAKSEYLAGEYSIADIATWPWVKGAVTYLGLPVSEYVHVQRWVDAIEARPAVQRGVAICRPPVAA
jgi:GST-like protein